MSERNFHVFLPMPTEKVKLIILDRELISYNTGIKNICKDLILKMVKTADDAAVLQKLKLHQVGSPVQNSSECLNDRSTEKNQTSVHLFKRI